MKKTLLFTYRKVNYWALTPTKRTHSSQGVLKACRDFLNRF